ncbi:MAG: lysine--tRNA ligase [Candidatus Marinimicrobia bacterium]|nr:lysine--tRNA ligase [Candidatus Neomarinimicrobiota bacterium]
MSEDQKSLKQIMDFRIQKLNKLLDYGVNPYPSRYKPTHKSLFIKNNYADLENSKVIVSGRIMAIRIMGKASFVQLMDFEGRIQIFIKKDNLAGGVYEHFKLLDIGDHVGIKGKVFTTKTGEISINAQELVVLSKSIRPLPIVKEKDGEVYDAFNDKEQRYRNRHLDLILNPLVKKTFIKRTKILKSIRNYLDEQGFLEVETPILQPIYGGANARPFTTHHNTLGQDLFLRIADELYLKRLIIGGLDKVYEMSKDFRNEGMDKDHNPEFTMLEFYWAYSDYEDCMNLVEDLIKFVSIKVGSPVLDWGKNKFDLSQPFNRVPFFDLLKNELGYDISEMDYTQLKKICLDKGLEVDSKNNVGQLLDLLISELVEPKLIEPTFVTDYPKSISPLAKMHRNGNKNIVERFELFIGGSEFANSFSELNDPIDQRRRLEEQVHLKELGDDEAHPIDESFIQAMENGMPPTGGVGIGIDRLTMLLTGNRSIKDVILFPALKSEKE